LIPECGDRSNAGPIFVPGPSVENVTEEVVILTHSLFVVSRVRRVEIH
jgi:hypothetical protein